MRPKERKPEGGVISVKQSGITVKQEGIAVKQTDIAAKQTDITAEQTGITVRQASITVEAAFVMPIVIYMIFTLIYLSFFLHDRCVIQGKVDLALFKAVTTMKNDADLVAGNIDYEAIIEQSLFDVINDSEENKARIKKYLIRELEADLFLSKLSSVEVMTDMFEITINAGFKTKVTLPLFGQLFHQYSYQKITENAPIHNPAETIRAAEVILSTGSEIKGMDQLKESIDKILN